MKKIGNIPDGGGWRFVGRSRGQKKRASTPDKPKNKWHGPRMGYVFVHTCQGTNGHLLPSRIGYVADGGGVGEDGDEAGFAACLPGAAWMTPAVSAVPAGADLRSPSRNRDF